jgi:hypothetical protein
LRPVDFVRIILGHGLFNEPGELLDGPIAVQRVIVFPLHALALLAVAFGALLPVNLPAIRIGLRGADWLSATQHEDERSQKSRSLNGSHDLYD